MAIFRKRFKVVSTDTGVLDSTVVELLLESLTYGVDEAIELDYPNNVTNSGWRYSEDVPNGRYNVYIDGTLYDGSGLTLPLSPIDIFDVGASQQQGTKVYAGSSPTLTELNNALANITEWCFFTKAGGNTWMALKVLDNNLISDFHLVELS